MTMSYVRLLVDADDVFDDIKDDVTPKYLIDAAKKHTIDSFSLRDDIEALIDDAARGIDTRLRLQHIALKQFNRII